VISPPLDTIFYAAPLAEVITAHLFSLRPGGMAYITIQSWQNNNNVNTTLWVDNLSYTHIPENYLCYLWKIEEHG